MCPDLPRDLRSTPVGGIQTREFTVGQQREDFEFWLLFLHEIGHESEVVVEDVDAQHALKNHNLQDQVSDVEDLAAQVPQKNLENDVCSASQLRLEFNIICKRLVPIHLHCPDPPRLTV